VEKYDTRKATNSGTSSFPDKRREDTTLMMFNQVDPSDIVDGIATSEGYLARDFVVAGEIRETCPECKTTPLKLVLLPGVKSAHLFCPTCRGCFDACYVNGSPVLEGPCFCNFD
jgi:hypothetical protein